MARRNQRHRASCPFELYMDMLAGKWKGMIVFRLKDKAYRFSELKKSLSGISNRMLTLSLRELEEDHIIARHITAAVPPKVSYTLSEIGKQLIPTMGQISQWGGMYQQYLKDKTEE